MDAQATRSLTLRRALAWAAAVVLIALGCLAALVGLLDTQRVCFGFDEICDGPKWGDAVIAFGIAASLFGLSTALVVRLRRRAP
jgi:hypothetical protein